MVIVMLVEGETEQAFMPILRDFLSTRLADQMPKIKPHIYKGRIPKEQSLRRVVEHHLIEADYVIALTDVYTGSSDFSDANDAKKKMREWVGNASRFFPHAAQYDFEAWLLPFWPTIQGLAKTKRKAPSQIPESVNHNKPPAHLLKEIFEPSKRSYVKPRDALRILKGQNLEISAKQCPELKALLNTFLSISGAEVIQ